jgi:hypothetical protein
MACRWRFITSSYFRTFLRISKFWPRPAPARWLDRVGDLLVLDRHVVGHVEGQQGALDEVGLEQPHQVVFSDR